MERVPGRPIGDAWFDLSDEQRLKVLHDFVQLEAKLFALHLPASGSIYFAHDLPQGTSNVKIPGSEGRLCVGPYAALHWWWGERGGLDVDLGPRKFYPMHLVPRTKILKIKMSAASCKLLQRKSWPGLAHMDALPLRTRIQENFWLRKTRPARTCYFNIAIPPACAAPNTSRLNIESTHPSPPRHSAQQHLRQ